MANIFDYLSDLNEVQREAVMSTEGPSLIIAGAGSGKTRVLTFRIAHLLKQGIRPSTILALTFTNKAAGEMKERIAALVGPALARNLWMGTFHSIFARILRIEHEAAGFPADFTIYDSADSKNLIKSIIKDTGLDDKVYRPGMVASRISMAKNNLISPGAYAQNAEIREYDRSIQMPRISELYKEYLKRCRLSHTMDFDDLLMMTNLLFRDHPDILERYQQKFDYILVDEYQDTNYSQYLIINKLAEQHHNITVVGDDAQSIYAFRGARIENIFSFRRDYPEHKVFKLEQNYRSTQNIVNAANSVIAHNRRQIHKTVFSEKEAGPPVIMIRALSDSEEGVRIAALIAENQLRDHLRFSDYAILYRTNAQSRIFEEALRKRNIPYKIYGGLSFYQRKEIKDLLAWFRMIVNPDDNEALKRIINYPARGIGETTLSKLERSASDHETSIWKIITAFPEEGPTLFNKGTLTKIEGFTTLTRQFMEKATFQGAYELAREVATETGILKELYNDRSPEGLSRYQNVEELLNALQEFTINAREEGRGETIGHYLQEVALLTDQDNEKEEDRNKVTLMTVHAAKGLEFNTVFIAGMERNLFPSSMSGEMLTEEETEEERRLFYVALTRAKRQVYLSWAGQRYRWGKLEFCQPSPFLRDIDPAFIESSEGELRSGSLSRQGGGYAYGMEEPPEMDDTRSGRAGRMQRAGRSPGSSASQGTSGLRGAGGSQGAVGLQGAGRDHASRQLSPQTGRPSPTLKSSFDQKIARLRQDPPPEQDHSDPSEIVAGATVEHQRFGIGKVLQVEGTPPDLKVTVFFHNAGQKQLLLRFARLRIIR